jgi:SNF2 family DNA or RNA helicase
MELRPYQIEDMNKLKTKKAMGCFNEQRTGKTPTTLVTLNSEGYKKILIVTVSSAIFQWAEEFTKWTGRPCVVVSGTKTQREKQIASWTDGLVISYDTIKTITPRVKDKFTMEETKGREGHIEAILAQKPEAVIIDEAHKIKNPKSAVAKSIFKLNVIERKLALTGTPAPNKPWEIYSILHFLYPKKFVSYWKFINEYFDTRRQEFRGNTFVDITGFKPGKKLVLQTQLGYISTNRKRKEVMPWLPEKDYHQVKLEPTKEQKKYLKELDTYFETENITVQGVLDRLIRERQICLAPEILNLKGKSPKLEWIKQFIKDYPEKPIIIFSKFKSFIKILEKEFSNEKFYSIIGDTTPEKRNEYKLAFQNGDTNILLIQIDVGKEALTLDRAEAIIFCDKFPPAADIAQAEDRFVATTKEKADKPHTIIELMMAGTYDENLYSLVQQRMSDTDVINNYKDYIKKYKEVK